MPNSFISSMDRTLYGCDLFNVFEDVVSDLTFPDPRTGSFDFFIGYSFFKSPFILSSLNSPIYLFPLENLYVP